MYRGTTLMSRRIPCFRSHKHAMFDTPGLFATSRFKWPVPDELNHLPPAMLEPNPISLTMGKNLMSRLVIKGMPIWLDIQLEGGWQHERNAQFPLRVTWYSHLMPVPPCKSVVWKPLFDEDDATNGIQINVSQQGQKMKNKPRVTIDGVECREVCSYAPPHGERHQDYSTDVFAYDLGWWAISSWTPFKVRVMAPSSAVIGVRECLFHPRFSKKQQQFLEENKMK